MRIAVTGCSGRIGRVVAEMALAQGHQVVGLDRLRPDRALMAAVVGHPAFAFVQAGMDEYAALEAALRGCEALIHMAAIPAPGYHPDHWVHNDNVVGSYNALRAAAEVGIRRVSQASSINAIGSAYSRWPRFDYFPIDEQHPTHNEDPYALSKWICEVQADSFARRYDMIIASLRFHGAFTSRPQGGSAEREAQSLATKSLWGYCTFEACARASLLGVTAEFTGHEVFFIVAPDTMMDAPTLELAEQHFPEVPIRGELTGRRSFFDCSKAERLLGWRHDPD
jgi:UDP-glucose 4-epimerase